MNSAGRPRSSNRALATSTDVDTSTPRYRTRRRTGSHSASPDSEAPHPASSSRGLLPCSASHPSVEGSPYFSTSHRRMLLANSPSNVSRFDHLNPKVSSVCFWASETSSDARRIPPSILRLRPRIRMSPPSAGIGAPSNPASQPSCPCERSSMFGDVANASDDIAVIVLGHAVVQWDRHACWPRSRERPGNRPARARNAVHNIRAYARHAYRAASPRRPRADGP